MKHNLFLILVLPLFLSLYSCAQQGEKEHLSFKGIPIDGSFKSFERQMRTINFIYHPKDECFVGPLYKDDPFSENNAFVGRSPSSDIVFAVYIDMEGNYGRELFDDIPVYKDSGNWRPRCANSFEGFIKLYTEKYGKPIVEKNPKQDFYYVIQKEKTGERIPYDRINEHYQYSPGLYVASYVLKNGRIQLCYNVNYDDHRDHSVFFAVYVDKINSLIAKKEFEASENSEHQKRLNDI